MHMFRRETVIRRKKRCAYMMGEHSGEARTRRTVKGIPTTMTVEHGDIGERFPRPIPHAFRGSARLSNHLIEVVGFGLQAVKKLASMGEVGVRHRGGELMPPELDPDLEFSIPIWSQTTPHRMTQIGREGDSRDGKKAPGAQEQRTGEFQFSHDCPSV